jgi:KDO2-lipid IV(A) lauroyltransferase
VAEVRDYRDFLAPRYWPTWLGLGFMRALSILPLPVLAGIGSAIGMLFYALHAGRRRVVRRNITRCFPGLTPVEHARLIRAHYRAAGQATLDEPVAWFSSAARLRRLVRFRGREHYDGALAAGRNIILLAPHFVGLGMGGFRLSMERPMVSVYRNPKNELLALVMLRARSRFGGHLVEHNKPFTTLVRLVRNGLPLYYLPDQDAGRRNSVFAPFFGIPAATFAVLPRLADMTNAVVIACWTRQLPHGRGYEVSFRPPIENVFSGDALADTTRMNREIEECVKEAPAQYFWLHKRFKTQPEGRPDFYRRDV